MKIAEQISSILHLGLGLFAIWVLFYYFWRTCRIDVLRQRLFELRDELFDYARSGNVRFDEPAYYLLRRNINGMIRFAHRVNFPRLLLALIEDRLFSDPIPTNVAHEWSDAVAGVDNFIVQQQLKEMHTKLASLVLIHIIKGSPVLWVGVACFLVGVKVTSIFERLKTFLWSGFPLLEEQAIEAQLHRRTV